MHFGSSLALSGDTLVVGAPLDDYNGLTDAGSVYVFQRNGQTNQWVEVQKLTASDSAQSDRFGSSLALDGDFLVIGAPYADFNEGGRGAAYIFQRSNGAWSETQKIHRPNLEDSHFGWAVALDSGRLAVGAPNDNGDLEASITFYQLQGSHFLEQDRLEGFQNLGYALDLRGDLLLAGMPDLGESYDRNYQGRARLYRFGEFGWTFQQTLLSAPPRSQWENFGRSVAFGDGWIAVGADNWDEPGANPRGRLRLFQPDQTGTWVLHSTVEPVDRELGWGDGIGAALAFDGPTLISGAPGDDELGNNAGAAYVFDLTGQSGTRAILTDVAVAFGTPISVSLNHLKISEDTRAKVRSQFGFSAIEPNVSELRIGARSYIENPATLDLLIEARITQPGGTMKVRLRNWNANSFQQVHQYTIGTSETVEPVSDIPAGSYIRANDDRVEVSLRSVVFATFAATGFEAQHDFINVLVHD